MRIPICIPTYNRPEYLIESLGALSKCVGLDQYQIVTSEEPGFPETQIVLDKLLPTLGIPVSRNLNPVRLGNTLNLEQNFIRGFATGAEWVISLEDDVVLARDGLKWLEWAINTYWDEDRIVGASAWSRFGTDKPKEEQLSQCALGWQFMPWGCAINKQRFDELRFIFQEAEKDGFAWDMKLSMYMPLNHCMQLQPLVSRAQNIGKIGNATDEAFWREHHYVTNFIGEVWPDYPLVKFETVRDEDRKRCDRACIFNTANGKVPLKTRSFEQS